MKTPFETVLTAHEGADHIRAVIETQDWTLDWDNQPCTYKRHPDATRIELPRTFPAPMLNLFEAAEGVRHFQPPTRIDLPMLAQWLWSAYGITATKEYGEGKILYRRTAPSGGALYPAEVYFFVTAVEGLDPGFYHFDLSGFTIEQISGPELLDTIRPLVDHPGMEAAPLIAVLSSIWWRNAWKYRWRNFRYCNQDLGHVIGNMQMTSECLELDTTTIHSFADEPVNHALGFESRIEGVLAFVAVHLRTGGADPDGAAVSPHTVPKIITLDQWPGHGDAQERSYDNVEAAKEATQFDCVEQIAGGRVHFERPPIDPALFSGATPLTRPAADQVVCTDPIRAMIDRRTSRDYTEQPITADDLSLILGYAYRGYRSDLYGEDATHCRFEEVYINIHAVEGIEPGAYYYDVEAHTLRVIQLGDFRKQSEALNVDQACAGRATASIFRFADLKKLYDTFGPRGYRYPIQEGGITGGRLYLAARSLGIGTGAIGAFWDDECSPFFKIDNPYMRPLYTITLGYEIEDTRIVDTA